MFCAMAYRRPHDPQIGGWAKRAGKALTEIDDLGHVMLAGFKLIQWHGGRGSIREAGAVISSIRTLYQAHPSPTQPATAAYWAAEAYLAWQQGEAPRCLEITNREWQMAQESGLEVWSTLFPLIGLHAALCLSDIGLAKKFLISIEPRCEHQKNFMGAYYHGICCWAKLLEGNLSQADTHNTIATQFVEHCGANNLPAVNHHIMHALLLREQGGGHSKISEYIEKGREAGNANKNSLVEFLCRILEAQLSLDTKDVQATDKYVARALSFGRTNGLTFTFMWNPSMVARLCVHALKNEIEVDYAKYLIRAGQLVPEDPFEVGENWPWPVRIRTLGTFSLEVDGREVEFSRKAQSRPLALLKALITMGGRDVSEWQLSEVLWPEAEGDAAHQAWATTLHRLRDLLGDQQSVRRREGRLTLNSQVCWIDALAFDELSSGSHLSSIVTSTGSALQTAQRAISLYHGPFLRDEEESWFFAYRERLRGQFIRHVEDLCAELESGGNARQAIECLEEAIQKEPLVEGLYQQLMEMLARQGYRAQVATVYDQCRAALQSALGTDPSQETTQVFKKKPNFVNILASYHGV